MQGSQVPQGGRFYGRACRPFRGRSRGQPSLRDLAALLRRRRLALSASAKRSSRAAGRFFCAPSLPAPADLDLASSTGWPFWSFSLMANHLQIRRPLFSNRRRACKAPRERVTITGATTRRQPAGTAWSRAASCAAPGGVPWRDCLISTGRNGRHNARVHGQLRTSRRPCPRAEIRLPKKCKSALASHRLLWQKPPHSGRHR